MQPIRENTGMKKISLIVILLALVVGQSFADNVSPKLAFKAAQNFYTLQTGIVPNSKSEEYNFTLSHVETNMLDTVFYAFSTENKGFVLISADDLVKPVLAYSTTGSFMGDNMPPAAKYLLGEYSDQIALAKRAKIGQTEKVKAEWNKLLASIPYNYKTTVSPEIPLLDTKWGQGWPYNEYCPADADGPAGHALVGCVAISMGQIMKYYNFPAQGSGSSSYYANGYGNQTANYGATQYEFYNIPNVATESNSAIAELLYHCGVGAEMNYGPEGSGAQVYTACDAMENHFNYGSGWEYPKRSDYSDSQWKALIKNEIDNNRPMIYVGYDGNSGHAWNCDGYQGDYFHMNWGWSGNYDGFFSLDNMTPSTYDFYQWHRVTLNIYPGGNYPEQCGTTTITGIEGTFNDGSGPEEYQSNADCSWEIIPACGQYVYLTIDQMDIVSGDTLYIYDGLTVYDPLITKLSDTLVIPSNIISDNGGMLLRFVSNSNNQASGWSASYSVDFCTGNRYLTDEMGSIEDGSGNCDYKNASVCKWYIQPANADSITIDFTSFDLYDDIDNVKIYQDDLSNLFEKFNFDNLPFSITVPSGEVIVSFFANNSNNAGGWSLDYEAHFSTNSIEDFNLNLDALTLYPNPVEEQLTLSGTSTLEKELTITIINSVGQVLIEENNVGLLANSAHTINVSNLPEGVYFVQLSNNSQVITKRFVKQ